MAPEQRQLEHRNADAKRAFFIAASKQDHQDALLHRKSAAEAAAEKGELLQQARVAKALKMQDRSEVRIKTMDELKVKYTEACAAEQRDSDGKAKDAKRRALCVSQMQVYSNLWKEFVVRRQPDWSAPNDAMLKDVRDEEGQTYWAQTVAKEKRPIEVLWRNVNRLVWWSSGASRSAAGANPERLMPRDTRVVEVAKPAAAKEMAASSAALLKMKAGHDGHRQKAATIRAALG